MGAGRKRTFDAEVVLLKAMEVFWQKGYSGTSVSDLTEAMGITKPSLYTAFGSKEALFVSTINQYVEVHGAPHVDKLLSENVNLSERLRTYLQSVAEMVVDSTLPGGCFVTNSTCETGGGCLPEDTLQTVHQINKSSTDTFVDFFNDEQLKGNIHSDEQPEVLSDYLLTTQFGLAVMARNGADKEKLHKIIEQAIKTFER
jgi:AcrR family transcriptional regulator